MWSVPLTFSRIYRMSRIQSSLFLFSFMACFFILFSSSSCYRYSAEATILIQFFLTLVWGLVLHLQPYDLSTSSAYTSLKSTQSVIKIWMDYCNMDSIQSSVLKAWIIPGWLDGNRAPNALIGTWQWLRFRIRGSEQVYTYAINEVLFRSAVTEISGTGT